ncbi:neurogenic locus notch homolog protein 1 isoform X1 [Dendroctonus ponderosae]|uniref:EGF-like domain-containing protein n=1 Tax=Dendroctonus ponderosae TaxID=77166 RepID=J3JUR8_DENPD|nr:neurogenic locus notch homolog protein 1 isoform X1 [Dendroctonus ponderosae]AEE61945.1 unknown [Dendroctonus ponderosae]ERL90523.1 hypothetical protein D910_07871 [Dendroctonus ponderosae]
MGTQTAALCSLVVLQILSLSSGEPPYYRTYRVLSGSPYYNNYYTYNRNPYVENSYRYTYPSRPLYDDKVYITDRYGNTVAQTASEYNRYVQSSSYRNNGDCEHCPSGYFREAQQVTTCTASTCGQNAQCQVIGGRPVCSCYRGYSGDPLSVCTRSECLSDGECRGHLTCRNGRCIDPCSGTCGINADCQTRNHVPVCSCPPGYTGSPFSSCRRFDPSELCHPSPCGQNTNCEVVNGVPTCKCRPGFLGSPIAGCRHECERDGECNSNQACIDFRCQNPCSSQCGENADCSIRNHQAVCSCPKNYFGNPSISCKPECYGDVDCPAGRPACFYGICKNPCDGVCGVGADCNLRGLTPICSCPKDMTGDPFVSCRPFDSHDLCEPNPCGSNAYCEPGFETRNPAKERPVCFCQTGYIGNPVAGCRRGECLGDPDCPNNQACIDYVCQNPCVGQCGVNAECNPRNHLAVCTCPTGYQGDALSQCYLNRGQSASRYIRYKRALEELAANLTLEA